MAVASPEAKVAVAADLPPSSPRISFSADFSRDNDGDGDSDGDFICIRPVVGKEEKEKGQAKVTDFEFLSENANSGQAMMTADELFFEGKLLPFWQMQQSEKLKGVSIKTKEGNEERVGEEDDRGMETNKDKEDRVSWFLDDDPSPRPPKCTVLWKELLRLKKQKGRASSLSPSSSSSSTSSSSSSLGDAARKEEREKEGKRGKKGLVRTRSSSMRIRPMINVPICSHPKSSSSPLPPLFPLSLKKGRVDRRS
ncbi:PREDICTED: uncharacterized protein LOC104818779 [Tarenaya hassleriana]|uniref:uncharacterized protein LOC104818779 n=1 Tax=Tarenaya hassleriana TaxID=28532 RepID=UPI00053C231B|nr:PREDICTED: uncharacterized protein LOC104818779 [Tarenaya hassleriana]